MSDIEDFLTNSEEEEIISTIREAEQSTSGEIRIHIEHNSKIDVIHRAKEVFHYLKMDNTKLRNGVLIYIAVDPKTFVIYGDKGINDVVPEGFWKSTKDIMQSHFKAHRFKQGLIEGVLKAGEQLEQHFPWNHDDFNELPNEISKG